MILFTFREHICVLIIVFHHCNARRRQLHMFQAKKFICQKSNNVCDAIVVFLFYFSLFNIIIRECVFVVFLDSLISSLYIIIFLIYWKRSINWSLHVMKHSFMILVFLLFMRISYVKRLVNSSKYFFDFEYNLITFLIELFRAMIMMINTFIWSNEVSMIAISLLKVRDFKSEFKATNKLNE